MGFRGVGSVVGSIHATRQIRQRPGRRNPRARPPSPLVNASKMPLSCARAPRARHGVTTSRAVMPPWRAPPLVPLLAALGRAASGDLGPLDALLPSSPRRSAPRHEAPRCGARCRDGHPCNAPPVWDPEHDRPRNGRCRLHGGLSTGARTSEGRERQRAGASAWRDARTPAPSFDPEEFAVAQRLLDEGKVLRASTHLVRAFRTDPPRCGAPTTHGGLCRTPVLSTPGEAPRRRCKRHGG